MADHSPSPAGAPDTAFDGHFTDAEIAGRITPLAAAGLWWCSALRVEVGLGPVQGLWGPWDLLLPHDHDAGECEIQHRPKVLGRWSMFICPDEPMSGDRGWRVAEAARGPETGDAGKLAADTAALSAGFALLNDGEVLLPFPDRIARLRLTDNNATGGREEG